jgi:hypothetical protein
MSTFFPLWHGFPGSAVYLFLWDALTGVNAFK